MRYFCMCNMYEGWAMSMQAMAVCLRWTWPSAVSDCWLVSQWLTPHHLSQLSSANICTLRTSLSSRHCNIRSKIVSSLLTSSVVISNCDQHLKYKVYDKSVLCSSWLGGHLHASLGCGVRGHWWWQHWHTVCVHLWSPILTSLSTISSLFVDSSTK